MNRGTYIHLRNLPGPDHDPALKGVKGGNCNREACQKPGATWFNKGSKAYYCRSCASLINIATCRDGTVLCSPT